MYAFVTAADNLPFTVALTVMLGIAVLEGVTTLLGAALSGLLDGWLPEIDLPADLAGADPAPSTALSKLLGWLRVGEVPALMLLVVFLTGFGLIGLGLQSFWQGRTGGLLPAAVAALPALFLTLPVVRLGGGLLGRIMPRDETDAVSEDSLLGRVATVTLGIARQGAAAQAKVRDARGKTHYVMVAPDTPAEQFPAGSEVLLVRRHGAVFTAIRNPHPVLSDAN